ncbi:DNA polymerase III subunit gamma/tau [Pseudoroseomonas wenyumeiae]|uniref:DNA polymerase III subunit gamma/tau n=1 Tax=Teichococcus wenyumeiae TaxID=2478470 RepID=A0A3A9JGP0_9PROT|nr:DNA polymerase III subunit gamma/tau [Pseudoroseomonas wenyumeiae]RKK02734.1 DNA polymerase III subunit gamma/tau [Pseudoroseomonas wenyumeiae]RMI26902.1 DNA polymerase III subunit gamma/tau [Pseudoroseomonas wenyumeiae]
MPSDTLPDDDAPPPPDGPGLFGDAPPVPEGPGLFGEAPAAPVAAETPNTPYRVLARKYRPQTFADLIGQEALVRTLRNAFAQNRVAHAFMLTGVRGVGKTTTARIIARALNCIGPDGQGGPTADPCGVCPECQAILADRHPDVLELDAASNNGVDNIRELREAVRYRPAQARFKVYILDEVHMLSTAAFNALLKTLEEPPPQVKFLFATTEIRKVPATILSRCQRFDLRRVPQEQLREHFTRICGLERVTAEEEAVAMIARAADGSVRDGLSLLDQAMAQAAGAEGGIQATMVRDMLGLADRGLLLDLLEGCFRGDIAAVLATMDHGHERGADPGVILADLLELTHTLTRLRAVPALRQDPAMPEAERVRGVALAEKLSIPVLGRAWQVLLKGITEVAEAPDRRAAAEMVLIRLAHLAEMPTPGDLVRRLTEGGSLPQMPAPAAPQGGSGGARAVANGAPVMVAEEAPAPLPQPRAFREVVALASGRMPMLHAHLLHSVHLVSFAPGRLELRPRPEAPRDLAGQLSAFLAEATGTRWTISLTNAEGEPTLAEQSRHAAGERLVVAQSHPMVQAILLAFPGAKVEQVRDESLDDYGLPALDLPEMPDDMGPDFAPPEAESVDLDDL